MNAHDPIVDHTVGQVGGSLTLLGEISTRLGSLAATLSDVAAAVVSVPGLDQRAALVLSTALEGEISQIDRVRRQLDLLRATLARAALKDATSFCKALRA